jgi:hypothetical protein
MTEAERTRASKKRRARLDALAFNTPEKSDRYRTERFYRAIGLNWYECDDAAALDDTFRRG